MRCRDSNADELRREASPMASGVDEEARRGRVEGDESRNWKQEALRRSAEGRLKAADRGQGASRMRVGQFIVGYQLRRDSTVEVVESMEASSPGRGILRRPDRGRGALYSTAMARPVWSVPDRYLSVCTQVRSCMYSPWAVHHRTLPAQPFPLALPILFPVLILTRHRLLPPASHRRSQAEATIRLQCSWHGRTRLYGVDG